MRRNPRVVTRRWFLKRASLFGVDLPVTFRLTPVVDQAGTPAAVDDDTIQISLGSDPTTAPLPTGVAAGDVTSTVKGRIAGSLRFSQDPAGYGQIGAVELGFGQMDLTASGIDLVNDANPATCTLLSTNGPISIGDAPGSQGFVNLFGGTFSIDLHTAFSFTSLTRSLCTDPFTTTALMDGVGRPPLPIRIDGAFRLSPALTADGRVRLGKLTAAGAQHDSYVQVHTCTAAPPPSPCAPASDGVLPGRLLTTSFSAELLVGNIA
jgi:hypothetical protein